MLTGKLGGVLFGIVITLTAIASESINFSEKPMMAGKSFLAENGFAITRTLGTANFSPDLKLPIQLVYNSASQQNGLFGRAWRSPQLESTATDDRGGILWTTPWGEQIKLQPREKITQDTMKLYAEAMKSGKSFFAPYTDWEAETTESASGNYVITGKRSCRGWTFAYHNSRLQSIVAPSGFAISYNYEGDKLVAITQNNLAFVKMDYNGELVTAITINGITSKLDYSDCPVRIMPETLEGKIIDSSAMQLTAITNKSIAPIEFSYDASGYLACVAQGDFSEQFTVEIESFDDRQSNLRAKEQKLSSGSGRVSGRLLADGQYKYHYNGITPGNVTLTDNAGQNASYDYDMKSGIFHITEFSGRKYDIHYFMRFDVAYMGKVKMVVDGRGRKVAGYTYDRKTGDLLKMRDMVGNETVFSYETPGFLSTVSQIAAGENVLQPRTGIEYNSNGAITAISNLNPDGNPVTTVSVTRDERELPTAVDTGRGIMTMEYNDFGYPIKITDQFGMVATIEYDAWNTPVGITAANGISTVFHRNQIGLISRIERKAKDALLSSLDIAYDNCGRPVKYTDQTGAVRRFERDTFGRVVTELFPDSTSVEFVYDELGRTAQVIDQNKNTIRFDWAQCGLDAQTTAAGQMTDYVYDNFGLLKNVVSQQTDAETADRIVSYEYDKFDRPVKITYGSGEVETMSYDTWGRVVASTRGNRKATCKFDYYGRLVEKTDGGVHTSYKYDVFGNRTQCVTTRGKLTITETRSYDQYGRLISISGENGEVKYCYNALNQLSSQNVNGVKIDFCYDNIGRLTAKSMGDIARVEYQYDQSGRVAARKAGDQLFTYDYDKAGRLLSVAGAGGNAVESYRYDKAGNIIEKTVNGKTAKFSYDAANQLRSKTVDGITTQYRYDAAGRLVDEGDKSYRYGYADRILGVSENGIETAAFGYQLDGQLAFAEQNGVREDFLWDGLALIHRGDVSYLNEPAITGGNPVLAGNKVMFNDMLGSTLGTLENGAYSPVAMTAFGETADASAFFTGKPLVGELGYAFLMRNYRADLGKWQTSDPLGYPDGWNNYAYCNNDAINIIDYLGAEQHTLSNPQYGSPVITGISYGGWLKGTCGIYGFDLGIEVTITMQRLVTYSIVCPKPCEANGQIVSQCQTATKKAMSLRRQV